MRDAVARRFGDAKVTHIPNGIDASAIQVSREDGGYVLYLGRLSSEKGVATLLKAHAADSAIWRLVVAGTGPLLSELRTQFPDAEFKGHLAGADLTSVIRGAAVVVVPSEWHENSPLSILEAMAHGKTVLASRIGGIPELVRDGLTGLLFASKDVHDLSSKIRLLLADRDLRGRLGAEARKVVEAEYSLQTHGAALLALYQSVVNPLKEQNRVGV
jgi:glycosyltransferase involved in cell wall biosynthesis